MFMKSALLAGITALLLSVSGSARTPADGLKAWGCPNRVDANGNGVCDRKEQGACPGGPGGAGRGQCAGAGNCARFVDENENGICDRKEQGECQGGGAGQGACKGAGSCAQFVDDNKNGICDRKEQGSCQACQGCGRGQGRGACRGFGGGRAGQAGSEPGANAHPQETGR